MRSIAKSATIWWGLGSAAGMHRQALILPIKTIFENSRGEGKRKQEEMELRLPPWLPPFAVFVSLNQNPLLLPHIPPFSQQTQSTKWGR